MQVQSARTTHHSRAMAGGRAKKGAIPTKLGPDDLLANARSELCKLVTQSLTKDYIYPGSKPAATPFALTLKKVSSRGNTYEVFNPDQLTADMLVPAISGKHAGKLVFGRDIFICCSDIDCRKKPSDLPTSWKVQIKKISGEGKMVLGHLKALVDDHIRIAHGGSLPAQGAEAAARVAQQKKERQNDLGAMANKLGFVSAIAQSVRPPAKTPTTQSTARRPPGWGSVLSPIDSDLMPDGNTNGFFILMLPMDQPKAHSFEAIRRSKLSSDEYLNVQAHGTVVSDDVFDLLRRIEMANFIERAPSVLKDAVLLVHRFDTAALIKAQRNQELAALTAEGGLFDKLCSLYQLDQTLGSDVELVCFGLSASVHFSECCWVVNSAKLYSFDSYTTIGHTTVVSAALQPFIEYVIDRAFFVEPNSLELVSPDAIAQQEIGSNVCAFAATLCLGKVLAGAVEAISTLTAIHGDDADDLLALGFSAELCSQMDAINTTMAMYKGARTQAAKALNKLSAEYLVKEKMQKAKEVTGKKRTYEPDDSSVSSFVLSSSSSPAPEEEGEGEDDDADDSDE